MNTSFNNYSSIQEEYVQYEQSFSTADIEDTLFYAENSPEYQIFLKPEGEFRLIGDELMKVDRQNFPPGILSTE